MHDNRVAIIGGGPSGIVAARYLKSEGFAPTMFERGERLGGQWSADPRRSGVWPSMRTNTSRIMTAFSDLQHPEEVAVYPTNQQVLACLERYADTFDVTPLVQFGTAVKRISRAADGEGWVIRVERAGVPAEHRFPRVVVASGRYQQPSLPN